MLPSNYPKKYSNLTKNNKKKEFYLLRLKIVCSFFVFEILLTVTKDGGDIAAVVYYFGHDLSECTGDSTGIG